MTWCDHADELDRIHAALSALWESCPCPCGGDCRQCQEIIGVGEAVERLAGEARTVANRDELKESI